MHLPLQRREIGKMPFLAEPFYEVHRDVVPVDLAIEVEDQDLEQRPSAADRGPCADTGDAIERHGAEPRHACGKDTVDGRLDPLQVHVGGRKTELAAET